MAQRSASERRIVGVMIDGDVLRGVELRRHVRGVRATAAAEIVVPEGNRIQGPVIDVDVLAEALEELWRVGGFSTKNVAFGVNGRDATIRPMTVPAAAADDVGGFVRYQLADYLSYELDDAVIAHQIVDDDETDHKTDEARHSIEVLAIAVPVALVDRLAEAVDQAGLTLTAIDAAPTALATTIDAATDRYGDSDAVVSVDGTRTTVVLRAGGRPRMVRVLAAGGGDHTARLADELEGMIARVEGHQRDGTAAPMVGGQDRRFAEAADAVAAAINYELREHTGSGADHVIVTGAFGRFESLHHLLTTAAGTPVTAAPPPDWWPQDDGAGLDDFDHYVEPAGLAFSFLAGDDTGFDLMPPTLLEERADRRELTVGVGLAGLVALGSLFALLPYRADVADARTDVEALEADVAALSARVDGLALVGDLDQARLAQIDSIAAALRDDLWWGRILDAIATATPDETYLTSMNLVRPLGDTEDDLAAAVVDFTGVSADQAAVGIWLERMDGLGIFEDIWLVQSTAAVLGESQEAAVTFLAQARLTSEARGPRAVDPTTWVMPADLSEEPS